MRIRDKYKPAVTKNFLIFLAGFVWVCVGSMLMFMAFSWLTKVTDSEFYLFEGAGIILALFIHHFGFLKIVDKNLERILPMTDKKCLFSFIPWKSYLIIAVMIVTGVILRHLVAEKQYLAILYTAIGFALILSSIRYVKTLFTESGKKTG